MIKDFPGRYRNREVTWTACSPMQNEERKSLLGHFPCGWKCQVKAHIHSCFSSFGPCPILSPCDNSQVSLSLCWGRVRSWEQEELLCLGPVVWNGSVCSTAHCCAPVNHVPLFWDDSLLYRAAFLLQSRDEWRWENEQLCCWDPNGPNCACCWPLLILATEFYPSCSACAPPDSWSESQLPYFL